MSRRERLDIQLDSAALLIQRMAQRMGDLRDHIAEQKARISPWPTRGSDAPVVTTTTESSQPERFVLTCETFDLWIADIEASERAIIRIAADMFEQMNKLIRMRAPSPELCNRKINAACENAASDHRDVVTGMTITGMCDDCWLAACPGCHDREADTRRRITVNGRLVPGCEACRRKELRRTGNVTTVTNDDDLRECG
jgi:hypothetical protein